MTFKDAFAHRAVPATVAVLCGLMFSAGGAQAQIQRQRQPAQESAAGAGAGRYALLREENKDSGCLVNLLPGGRAQLGPGCKDQGLVVFDPIGWSTGRNSIILRARKGHRVNFILKTDGTWLREPADKRPLALRKF